MLQIPSQVLDLIFCCNVKLKQNQIIVIILLVGLGSQHAATVFLNSCDLSLPLLIFFLGVLRCGVCCCFFVGFFAFVLVWVFVGCFLFVFCLMFCCCFGFCGCLFVYGFFLFGGDISFLFHVWIALIQQAPVSHRSVQTMGIYKQSQAAVRAYLSVSDSMWNHSSEIQVQTLTVWSHIPLSQCMVFPVFPGPFLPCFLRLETEYGYFKWCNSGAGGILRCCF